MSDKVICLCVYHVYKVWISCIGLSLLFLKYNISSLYGLCYTNCRSFNMDAHELCQVYSILTESLYEIFECINSSVNILDFFRQQLEVNRIIWKSTFLSDGVNIESVFFCPWLFAQIWNILFLFSQDNPAPFQNKMVGAWYIVLFMGLGNIFLRFFSHAYLIQNS